MLEVRLRGDAAVLGEHGAEHEDVELRLVVSDEDGGAGGAEDVAGVVNLEDDARGQVHEVLEGTGGDPLRDLLVAGEGEGGRGGGAEEGAGDEGDVGGEDAGDEAGAGHGEREGVEEDGEGEVAHEELDEVRE